jgi:hypothetical protein
MDRCRTRNIDPTTATEQNRATDKQQISDRVFNITLAPLHGKIIHCIPDNYNPAEYDGN